MMFRFWLYVEAQTCFGDFTLKRIGSKRQNGELCTTYEDLTPEEAKKVQPLIQSTRDQLESRIQGQKPESARKLDALGNVQAESVRTPSPSATR
jgi:hypothetical protein